MHLSPRSQIKFETLCLSQPDTQTHSWPDLACQNYFSKILKIAWYLASSSLIGGVFRLLVSQWACVGNIRASTLHTIVVIGEKMRESIGCFCEENEMIGSKDSVAFQAYKSGE